MPAAQVRLSIKQVADFLGVTPQRVSQLRGRADFPRPTVVGFRDAWRAADIRRWAEAHPCGRRRWGCPDGDPERAYEPGAGPNARNGSGS
jgi:predicted DNA-binding transcriptional regulator AlpA